tara:strand:+ start:594 stop:1721 length:1128 start_codon:yes stop_codon:yes gene_type:complete
VQNIIKKKIKFIYKKFVIFFFLKIYPKPSIKSINDQSFHLSNIRIDNKTYQIFELQKGRVFTNKNDIVAYISKKNILTKASLQFKKYDTINSFNQKIKKNDTLINGTPKFKKKVNGSVLSLLSGGASRDNFTHWFTDVLPRIFLYEQKFDLKKIDKFFVPSLKFRYQRESLNFLGISDDRIISSEKIKHIEGEKIYATSHPCHFYPSKVQKWSLNFLRSKFIKKSKKLKNYQKIFIYRNQAKLLENGNLKKYRSFRIIINEEEIKDYLQSKGYKIIKPEEYSLTDQISIFSNAKCVVGLFGASMKMLTFCKKNTKIFEIMPQKAGNEFLNISKKLKLKHFQLKIKPKLKSFIPQNGLIFCNIKLFEKKLKILKFL